MKRLLPDGMYEDFFSIAFVRNPVELAGLALRGLSAKARTTGITGLLRR